eukprot:snap_masked-scaffold_3-processed-gene-13.35-mRNA-1 protein AED:1.00 eAED:1.00 QI:0/-1/0/0/-1/1/1/0/1409
MKDNHPWPEDQDGKPITLFLLDKVVEVLSLHYTSQTSLITPKQLYEKLALQSFHFKDHKIINLSWKLFLVEAIKTKNFKLFDRVEKEQIKEISFHDITSTPLEKVLGSNNIFLDVCKETRAYYLGLANVPFIPDSSLTILKFVATFGRQGVLMNEIVDHLKHTKIKANSITANYVVKRLAKQNLVVKVIQQIQKNKINANENRVFLSRLFTNEEKQKLKQNKVGSYLPENKESDFFRSKSSKHYPVLKEELTKMMKFLWDKLEVDTLVFTDAFRLLTARLGKRFGVVKISSLRVYLEKRWLERKSLLEINLLPADYKKPSSKKLKEEAEEFFEVEEVAKLKKSPTKKRKRQKNIQVVYCISLRKDYIPIEASSHFAEIKERREWNKGIKDCLLKYKNQRIRGSIIEESFHDQLLKVIKAASLDPEKKGISLKEISHMFCLHYKFVYKYISAFSDKKGSPVISMKQPGEKAQMGKKYMFKEQNNDAEVFITPRIKSYKDYLKSCFEEFHIINSVNLLSFVRQFEKESGYQEKKDRRTIYSFLSEFGYNREELKGPKADTGGVKVIDVWWNPEDINPSQQEKYVAFKEQRTSKRFKNSEKFSNNLYSRENIILNSGQKKNSIDQKNIVKRFSSWEEIKEMADIKFGSIVVQTIDEFSRMSTADNILANTWLAKFQATFKMKSFMERVCMFHCALLSNSLENETANTSENVAVDLHNSWNQLDLSTYFRIFGIKHANELHADDFQELIKLSEEKVKVVDYLAANKDFIKVLSPSAPVSRMVNTLKNMGILEEVTAVESDKSSALIYIHQLKKSALLPLTIDPKKGEILKTSSMNIGTETEIIEYYRRIKLLVIELNSSRRFRKLYAHKRFFAVQGRGSHFHPNQWGMLLEHSRSRSLSRLSGISEVNALDEQSSLKKRKISSEQNEVDLSSELNMALKNEELIQLYFSSADPTEFKKKYGQSNLNKLRFLMQRSDQSERRMYRDGKDIGKHLVFERVFSLLACGKNKPTLPEVKLALVGFEKAQVKNEIMRMRELKLADCLHVKRNSVETLLHEGCLREKFFQRIRESSKAEFGADVLKTYFATNQFDKLNKKTEIPKTEPFDFTDFEKSKFDDHQVFGGELLRGLVESYEGNVRISLKGVKKLEHSEKLKLFSEHDGEDKQAPIISTTELYKYDQNHGFILEKCKKKEVMDVEDKGEKSGFTHKLKEFLDETRAVSLEKELRRLKACKEQGLEETRVLEYFHGNEALFKRFLKLKEVLRVPFINHYRLVHIKYGLRWVIVKSIPAALSSKLAKVNLLFDELVYDASKFDLTKLEYAIPRRWQLNDGTENSSIYNLFLNLVLTNIMTGISPDVLCERVSKLLAPIDTMELLQMLTTKYGVVTETEEFGAKGLSLRMTPAYTLHLELLEAISQ